MADSNLKEMMIDDINEDANEDSQVSNTLEKTKWYLIDTEKTFCKVWNFIITILIIYSLFVAPYVLVFSDVYNAYDEATDTYFIETSMQKTLSDIETVIDVIYLFEIMLKFVKKTRAH